MKMIKPSLLATGIAALSLCTGHAQAQTAVTLYGLVDTGVEYLSHAGPGGAGAVYRMSPGNMTGSRWGQVNSPL